MPDQVSFVYGLARLSETWRIRQAVILPHTSSLTLKKFATGHGNADKQGMIAEARRRFKADLADDNEADALWILDWARREILSEAAA